jgi:CubicO group peptidase (beta-lactamase class C family)
MTTPLPRALAIALMLAPTFPVFAAPPDAAPGQVARVNDALRPLVDANEIAGAVTLVATKDKVVHLAALGDADVSTHAPMKADTLFWIASMSKPITGTCLMMLADEGKVNYDDPVSKYIPEFANVKTPSGKPANLTIRHLATHTAGLAELSPAEQKACKTLADVIPLFVNKPTAFEPGTQWRYCQTGINSIGRIVEIVSGQSFPDFLAKRLTGPLGMTDTTFYPSREQQARLAKSYKRTADGKLEEVANFVFDGQDLAATDRVPLANGGLFSTAADYGRFLRMILNGGSLDGRQYLKPETVRAMTTQKSPEVPKIGFTPGTVWGVCWIVTREPQGVTAALSKGTAGHGGAYGTEAWVDFEKGLAQVLMIQRAGFTNQGGADGSEVRRAFHQAVADSVK